jgi:hypothetical protein
LRVENVMKEYFILNRSERSGLGCVKVD